MSIFGIGGWLFLSVLAVSNITSLVIEERHSKSKIARFLNYKYWARKLTWMRRPMTAWILFVVVAVLEVSQIWAYFLMQRQQYQMTQVEGVPYLDDQWAFGQVVAVVVFAPVLVEAWYVTANSRMVAS
jgi:hypothetical protein